MVVTLSTSECKQGNNGPLGRGRYDPSQLSTYRLERYYTVRSCIVCDRVYAYKNGPGKLEYITCCSRCSQDSRRYNEFKRKRKVERTTGMTRNE